MSAAGLVVRTQLPPPANVAVYELTDAGRALEPAIMALAGWGGRYMDAPRKDDTLEIGWGLLSLKRRYQRGALLSVELRIDERIFSLDLEADGLRVEERPTPRADLVLAGTTDAFRVFFFRGPQTTERLRAAGITVARGDEPTLARFVGSFLPPPTPPPTPLQKRPGRIP